MNKETAKAFYQFIESQGHRIPLKRKLIYGLELYEDESFVEGDLDLSYSSIESLPEGLQVGGSLNLSGCTQLKSLPEGLRVRTDLSLAHCTQLQFLPKGLHVGGDLHLRGCCHQLQSLPEDLKVEGYIYVGKSKFEYFKEIAPEHLNIKFRPR